MSNTQAALAEALSGEQISNCAWGYFPDSKNLPEAMVEFARAVEREARRQERAAIAQAAALAQAEAAKLPNCGACPGNGTTCPSRCRLADESPPAEAAPKQEALPNVLGLPFSEARARILDLDIDSAQGIAISLLIQLSLANKALSARPQQPAPGPDAQERAHNAGFVEAARTFGPQIERMQDALRSIREHCAAQPSALAAAIVATCGNGLRDAPQQPAPVPVAPGWRFERVDAVTMAVHSPSGSSTIAYAVPDSPRMIPEEVLYELAATIYADTRRAAPQTPAPGAEGGDGA